MDPSKITSPGAHVDELCICIPDVYPKSVHHGLVVARERGLDTPSELTPSHLPLLSHMRRVAMRWIWQVAQGHTGSGDGAELVFRLGFHAVPSMRQLHLHAIGTDLRGANMKRKDHFMSFATPYFMPLDQVEAQLREQGRVAVDAAAANQLLKGPIVCHRCGAAGDPGGKKAGFSFPQLQAHLATCRAQYPGGDAVGVPDSEPKL